MVKKQNPLYMWKNNVYSLKNDAIFL